MGLLALLACEGGITSHDGRATQLRITVVEGTNGPARTSHAVDSVAIILSGPRSMRLTASPGQRIQIDDLPVGAYTVRLEAYAGTKIAWWGESTVTVSGGATAAASILPRHLPVVSINSPGPSTVVSWGDPVTLTAAASDVESGDLTASILWTSSLDGALGSGGQVTPTLSRGVHDIAATVQDFDGQTAADSLRLTVDARPALTIDEPTTDTLVSSGDPVSLAAGATDAEDGDLSASVAWRSDLDGPLGTGATVTPVLSVGAHSVVASVQDSRAQVVEDTVIVTVVADEAPVVVIDEPPPGTIVKSGNQITISASASDAEDGDLSASISWSSDLDGSLGSGSIRTPTLTVGVHEVVATVLDSRGQEGADTITVTVAPVLQPADLCTGYPGYAIASFSDANLWDRVRGALGLQPQDDVTCALLGGLTDLQADQAGIANVLGLQNAVSLSFLHLGGNTITDLAPLSGLNSLVFLDLGSNPGLSDLAALGGLTALATLNLNGNAISGIGVLAALTSLTSLNLRANAVADISALTNLTALAFVDLAANAGLADIQPLLNNSGIGAGDVVDLSFTAVACGDVAALSARGVSITSDCTSPVLAIVAPSDTTVSSGAVVSFIASATDVQDGDLSSSVSWSSDLDGPMGVGASVMVALSSGVHEVVAAVQDSHGLSDADTVTVMVDSPPVLSLNQPSQDTTVTSDDAITLAAFASDAEDGDLSASISWSSDLDGPLASGATLTPVLSVGIHEVVATVQDSRGQMTADTVLVQVVLRILQPDELCADYPSGGIVSFADPELAIDIKNALGIAQSDDITCALAATLLDLTTVSPAIDDLRGMQNLTTLSTFYSDYTSISDLSPLAGLTSLTQLYLSQNQIADLTPLSGLTNLIYLWLWNNQVSDLSPLTGLTQLQRLIAPSNPIADFSPISVLTNLWELSLGGTGLTDISFLSTIDPVILTLYGNSITDISVMSGMTRLRDVRLDNNPGLADIQVLIGNASLGAGDTVWLDGTAVPCTDVSSLEAKGVTVNSDCTPPVVTISGPTQDTTVVLGDAVTLMASATDTEDGDLTSSITWTSDLDGMLGGGGSVSPTLSQGVHEIVASVVDSDGLAGADTVFLTAAPVLLPTELCSNFPAYAIPTFSDQNLEAAVRSELGIGGSTLSCASIGTLTTLGAGSSAITNLVGIQNLTGLTNLDLQANSITDISPLASLTGLESLTMNSNSVSDITALAGLTGLTYLSLYSNSISDVSALSGLTQLTQVNLNDNAISDIGSLSALGNLTTVSLAANSITDITALGGLASLYVVDLNNNVNLADVQPLIDNPGFDSGDLIDLSFTSVSCVAITALQNKGVLVVYLSCS